MVRLVGAAAWQHRLPRAAVMVRWKVHVLKVGLWLLFVQATGLDEGELELAIAGAGPAADSCIAADWRTGDGVRRQREHQCC